MTFPLPMAVTGQRQVIAVLCAAEGAATSRGSLPGGTGGAGVGGGCGSLGQRYAGIKPGES